MANRDVYLLDMNVDIAGLHSLPEGSQSAIGVFYTIMVQVVVKWGEDKKGMGWEEHVLFRQIRYKMEEAMKTHDPKLLLEIAEYDFLKLVLKEAKPLPQMNEAFFRVGMAVMQAKKETLETKQGGVKDGKGNG